MRLLLSLTVLSAIVSAFSMAQPTQAKGLKLSKTTTVFPFFALVMKEKEERGEFETREEYQKRLSKRFDTTAVYFFKLETTPASMYKGYRYDIDDEMLSIIGGRCNDYGYREYTPLGSTATVILTTTEPRGTFKASNAFGKTIRVEEFNIREYVLSFVNSDSIPDTVFNREDCTFRLSMRHQRKQSN
jgi:hypothetical protein